MGNQNRGRELAQRIEASRTSQGHTTRWLSDQTGIPYATLRRLIQHTPELFDIAKVSRISDALGEDFTYLIAGAA